MIKFFQKLKAKKGFTLVELIVVIAIIGVLAAILIPTMLGYVTSSRVTSADSTAAGIEDTIDVFLTAADTAGYGALQSTSAVTRVSCDVTNNNGVGLWTITVGNTNAFKSTTISWSGSGSGTANQTKSGVTNAEDLLAIELANKFPDVSAGTFVAYVAAGDCTCVMWTADSSSNGDLSDIESNVVPGTAAGSGKWSALTFSWDDTTAGVDSNGRIVGTSPKVNLG